MFINGMRFVNLTPHDISVSVPETDMVYTIPASSSVARADQSSEFVGNIAGIPVFKTVYGEVHGVPAPQPDTVYIVSALTAQAMKGREDVVIPGPAIRDSDGRVVGCSGFCKI